MDLNVFPHNSNNQWNNQTKPHKMTTHNHDYVLSVILSAGWLHIEFLDMDSED